MQVQCIMHFLQLPIEDEFMAELAQPVAPKGHPLPPAALTPPPPRPADSTARADGSAQPGADSAQEAAVPLEQGIHHQAVIPDGQPIPFADTGNPIMAQVGCRRGCGLLQLHLSLGCIPCKMQASYSNKAEVTPAYDTTGKSH